MQISNENMETMLVILGTHTDTLKHMNSVVKSLIGKSNSQQEQIVTLIETVSFLTDKINSDTIPTRLDYFDDKMAEQYVELYKEKCVSMEDAARVLTLKQWELFHELLGRNWR